MAPNLDKLTEEYAKKCVREEVEKILRGDTGMKPFMAELSAARDVVESVRNVFDFKYQPNMDISHFFKKVEHVQAILRDYDHVMKEIENKY